MRRSELTGRIKSDADFSFDTIHSLMKSELYRTIMVPCPFAAMERGEATMRTILLLLSAALCGCASKPSPSPQAVDARALCQQLAQASASSRELRSDAYFDQCMIANSQRPP
jgi:hypothetical protein